MKTHDFGLTDTEIKLIKQVFAKNPKVCGAIVFGSRAKGDYKDFSDVDIALFGELNANDVEEIIYELDMLPIVYKFDVLTYDSVKNPALREHIDRAGIRLYHTAPGETPP